LGLTQAETASLVGVSERTFSYWLKDRQEIADAWFRGGAYADMQVARALYHRATGAVTPDSHVAVINDEVTITPMEKHYPPDVGAARLWLKNRQPALWRDKVELEQPPTIALVDKERMDAMYERVLEQAAETQARMAGRAERLGLVLDSERGCYE
jgi:transcriptional regulator with XRE-family HTH domain